ATALEGTLRRAEHADELGFHRFWTAEHHAAPGIATGSPPLLIAAAAARTAPIRLGPGGVTLPNPRPLAVAGQLAMPAPLRPAPRAHPTRIRGRDAAHPPPAHRGRAVRHARVPAPRTRRPRRGAVPRFHRPGPGGARRHRLRHRRAGPRPHRGVGLPPRPRA